jgi:hypothetical protein
MTRNRKKEKRLFKMDSFDNTLAKFFGVVTRGQTYLNALYLLLAFPLGIFYFVFLITGISLGISLSILWVGLFILLAVYGVWYALVAFERGLAISLLHEEIPPMHTEDLSGKTLFQKFSSTLSNPVTWKGLVYLFVKFPLGILSFVLLVTLVSISAALVATPLYFQYIHPQIGVYWTGVSWSPMWVIDTMSKAISVSIAGIFLTIISMHILNALALVSGKFARIMLGNFSPAPTAPQTPIVSETPGIAV